MLPSDLKVPLFHRVHFLNTEALTTALHDIHWYNTKESPQSSKASARFNIALTCWRRSLATTDALPHSGPVAEPFNELIGLREVPRHLGPLLHSSFEKPRQGPVFRVIRGKKGEDLSHFLQ